MKKIIMIGLVAGIVLMPHTSHAASKRPAVTLEAPQKSSVFDRTESMAVEWSVKNISRDMVVVTNIKLVKRDTSMPGIGYTSGTGYQHTVHAEDASGSFTHDWGLNSTIPGKYSIRMELRECNRQGCGFSPAGKLLSKKTKNTYVTVGNSQGQTTDVVAVPGTSIKLLSPNGGESHTAGSGKNLTISWEAKGVPKGSSACTLLERQGGNGGMFVFPSTQYCVPAKEGRGSATGALLRTSGYDLAPGNYWARVSLIAASDGSGKDAGTLADDVSDSTFKLR